MNVGIVAAWIVFAFLVGLLVWAVARGRKGYAAVQTLMARVEAHAAADARAAASAVNSVHLDLSRRGSGRNDDYDGEYDDYRYHVAVERARNERRRRIVASRGGVGVVPGGVLAGDAVRDQVGSMIELEGDWSQ